MKNIKVLLILLLGLIMCNVSFALPFSITPIFLPTTIDEGLETFAFYRVTNITNLTAPNSFVKFLPPNVKQGINKANPSLCGPLFTLAPGQSCVLKLIIAGPVNANDPSPQHHLFVCRQEGKTCAGPSEQLNVTTISLVAISVVPQAASIPAGTSQRFIAYGTFSDGSSRRLFLVNWNSSNPSAAIINQAGLATGLSPGVTNITASKSGITSPPAVLTVTDAIITSITVSPANAVIHQGTTLQYTALATYSDGTTGVDVTNQVNWTSDQPGIIAILNVGQKGLATAVADSGSATITATDPGTSADDSVTATAAAPDLVSILVTPSPASIFLGQEQQFTATGFFTAGGPQNITSSVIWTSSNTGVATISTGVDAGLAISHDVGSTTITATFPATTISGTSTLNVLPASLALVFAGTSTGKVCKSSDSGVTWPTADCNSLAAGISVNALAAVANGLNQNSVYAGASDGKVYISSDNGSTYSTAVTLPGSILSVAAIPSTPFNYFYAGNSDGASSSVYSSKTPTTTILGSRVNALAAIDQYVYAGLNNGNVCTSQDFGDTFAPCVLTPEGANPITALAVDDNTVYAATNNGITGIAKVCISQDNGATWLPCTTPVFLFPSTITSLTVDENGFIYAGMDFGAEGQVCVSYNHGASWPLCTVVSGVGSGVRSLAVDINKIYAGGTNLGDVCYSSSGGTTWPPSNCKRVSSDPLPFSINALAVGEAF